MDENALCEKRNMVDRLKALDVALTKAMSAALRGEAVTASQAGILLFLAQRRGEPTPNRRIEEHFNISNPAASTMVKRLESKGLVTTAVNPDDKRCHCVSITDLGYESMVSADRKVKLLDETILAGFSPEEISKAYELIDRMAANLQTR